MGKSLQEVMEQMPTSERLAVESRFQELYAEEISLRALRKALKFTQEQLANELHIRQESVSRLEQRSDLLLSTLNSYIEAMGGKLKIIVEFPDRPPVQLQGLLHDELMAQSIEY